MKLHKSLLFACLFSIGFLANATTTDEKLTKENLTSKTDEEIEARIEQLENRLHEIKAIDFSTLERSERRALKEEVKEIKKEMALDGRITLSIGAAILIVVLLIILL